MKILFLFFLFLLGISSSSKANYTLDIKQVDRVINQAKEFNFTEYSQFISINQSNKNEVLMQKSPFVAWILTYTLLGFHRLYLGTSTGTFFAYFFTLGGFLVLDIVDYAVLLAAMIDHRAIDKYVDNPHFFMWQK